MTTPMPTRTVTLMEDAYDALSALKNEGESFSDVVRRLTGVRVPLSPFAGAWVGAPRATIREARDLLRAGDLLSRAKLRRLAGPGTIRR